MGIRWTNKDRFFKQLLSVVPEAEKEMGIANSKSADALVALAKTLVPVKTGKLRDSIHKAPGKKRAGSFIVSAGGPTTSTSTDYDYALAVEYGTVDTKRQRQPFFWPSFRVNKRPARDRVRRALTKAIKAKGFRTA